MRMHPERLQWSLWYLAGGGAMTHFGLVMWRLDDPWFAGGRYDGWNPGSPVWDWLGPAFVVLGLLIALPRPACTPARLKMAQDYLAAFMGVAVAWNSALAAGASVSARAAPLISLELLPFGVCLFVAAVARAWGRSIG